MSVSANFMEAYTSGKIKLNYDVASVKATAEKMKSLSKEELLAKLDDPKALLQEFGFELDDKTALAIKERIDVARSGVFTQASIVHVDL